MQTFAMQIIHGWRINVLWSILSLQHLCLLSSNSVTVRVRALEYIFDAVSKQRLFEFPDETELLLPADFCLPWWALDPLWGFWLYWKGFKRNRNNRRSSNIKCCFLHSWVPSGMRIVLFRGKKEGEINDTTLTPCTVWLPSALLRGMMLENLSTSVSALDLFSTLIVKYISYLNETVL